MRLFSVNWKRIGRALVIAAATLLTCDASLASSPQKSSKSPKASAPPASTAPASSDNTGGNGDGGILAGPSVDPDALQQPNRPGRPNANRGDQRTQMEVPFQQWLSALRGTGLSKDQQSQIRGIAEEFQKAGRDFQQEHGEELRTLFQQVREARAKNEEPSKDVRQKMKTLEEERPKPDPYKERIWPVLTEAQQGKAKIRLEEIRNDMMDKKDNRRESKSPGGPGSPGAEAGAASTMQQDEREMNAPAPPGKGDAMNATDEMASPAPAAPKARQSGPNALDDMGHRRLNFLSQHQSPRRPGVVPTDRERRFEFDERQPSDGMWDDEEKKSSPPPSPRD